MTAAMGPLGFGSFEFTGGGTLINLVAATTEVGLPVLGSLVLAVVGPTAGRFLIDVSCGVPPKQFVRGEWFVALAVLTGAVWIALDQAGLPCAASAPLAFVAGFTVRLTALYRGWEEPLAAEPAGVYRHDDGRPLLGRKIAGRSTRELRLLGLTVEPHQEPGTPSAGPTRGGHHDQP
ncbi:hypothetical protein ACN6K9_007378 [Streptomyces sp. SAS_267]|uniref:hypothetical protein n=1 Tax=Streptomyces sp. SAS_267 TaxID=3412750 RepID=UPI00403D27B1